MFNRTRTVASATSKPSDTTRPNSADVGPSKNDLPSETCETPKNNNQATTFPLKPPLEIIEGWPTNSLPRALSRRNSSLDLSSHLAGPEIEPAEKPPTTPDPKALSGSKNRLFLGTTNPAHSNHASTETSSAEQKLFDQSTRTHTPQIGEGSHYLTLNPGFEILINGEYVAPKLYQPTPLGLHLLVKAHKNLNQVDFRVHEKVLETKDTVLDRAKEFFLQEDLSKLTPNNPIAAILSHGQMHSIPLFLAVHEKRKYLLILDSTSGPIQRQYWELARQLPDFQVRLNAGTRQADSQSCINDAVEILKQCFTIGNLIDRVESRRRNCDAPTAPDKSRLKINRSTRPENFSIFDLPEELAFVAQRATFLEESNLDMGKPITVEGRTCPLGMHVTISTEFGRKMRTGRPGQPERIRANTYLYQASDRHRAIIEEFLTRP